ncbi:MAG: hypothetical protein HKN62_14540, partial [Phycisphaerales bacterium]|nr:hypothetical protein [Phycisphaerales bacterium]
MALAAVAAPALNLRAMDVLEMDVDPRPGRPLLVTVPIRGATHTIDLLPHSDRSPKYRVLVPGPGGALKPVRSGPIRTLRGSVLGVPGSVVAGAVDPRGGLSLSIRWPDGSADWIEPLSPHVPAAHASHHILYRGDDVVTDGETCGTTDALLVAEVDRMAAAGGSGGAADGGTFTCAELACDADFPYYSDYGSTTAVEDQINLVISTMNVQYERDVDIRHVITTIIVRTSAGDDPYSSSDAETLLNQFRDHWQATHGGIPRDVAQLFTGREIIGGTIGIAWVGAVCTSWGYGVVQSDFNGVLSCATDLSAHELGHNWDAGHCSCTSHTMNPSITCSNVFHPTFTIPEIVAYRNGAGCLETCTGAPMGACCLEDGSCTSVTEADCGAAGGSYQGDGVGCAVGCPTPPPPNDLCVDAIDIPCNSTITVSNVGATPPYGGADDPDIPAGSPTCHWNSTPDETHNTIWYTFVAQDTSVEIRTCDTTAINDTILALYAGSCGSLVELECSEDVCGGSTWHSRICRDGLTPGNTYTILVANPGAWTGSDPGEIVLDVNCPCPDIGPVAGACCLPAGGCDGPVTPGTCTSLGGTFQGPGSDCVTADCDVKLTGACCLNDGTCVETTDAGCAGIYQGDGTDCLSVSCPQPGACCLVDGSCVLSIEVGGGDCAGTYQGDDTTCGGVSCPQPPGACCFDDGSCTSVTEEDCVAAGGAFQGDGIACAGACPQPGACCLVDGSCVLSTEVGGGDCAGTYQGDDTTCGGVSCPQPPGACCF